MTAAATRTRRKLWHSQSWLCAAASVGGVLLLLCLALPAQIVAAGAVGLPSRAPFAGNNVQANLRVGVALPPAPHLLVLWNIAQVGYDRYQGDDGVALETGLEAWLGMNRRPALSHGPLLLLEGGLGRRWGTGLHGYQAVGAGLGWSLGDWVPYAEFRRRASFHAGRPVEHQIIIGVHFVLFG